jgi:DNA-binding NarL/FixJ family response regulator
MTIRVAFSDPQPLVLEGLGHVFRSREGFEIVASCRTGAEALEALRQHRPDVLICELRLPDMSGIQVLEEIVAEGLPTRMILLTGEIRDGDVRAASRLGVSGVMLKEMPVQTVVQCVRKVYAGEVWIENKSAARALQKMFRREGDGGFQSLTDREREVALMIGRGLPNKDIASRLAITRNTVKAHLSHIYTKLGVDGRLALLRYVEDKGPL